MRRLVYGIVVGLGLSGCADDDPELNCSRVNYRTCDIRTSACQHLVFDQMKCLRGYDEGTRMPPVFVVTDDELRAEFEEAAANAEPEPDLETIYAGLALLGMVEAEISQEETQVGIPLEGLLGFYSHESQQIVVVDSGEPLDSEQATTTLGHEYIHALQDQDFDLSDYTAETSLSFDSSLAATSVIEGEAMLYDGFQLARIQGADPALQDWPGYYENFTDQADQLQEEDSSPLISARSIFPYTYGSHTAALAFEESEEAGLVANRGSALFTQGFLVRRHGGAESSAADPDTLVVETIAGRRSLGQEVLGGWLLNAFAVRFLDGTTPTPDVALGWNGDVLSLFVNESTEATELIWKIQFRDVASADAFSAALVGAVPAAPGVWNAFTSDDLAVIVATTDETADLSELNAAAGGPPPAAAEPDPTELAAAPVNAIALAANRELSSVGSPSAATPVSRATPSALSSVLRGLRGGCVHAPRLKLQQ